MRKCEKCGKQSLGYVYDLWLCGDCIIKVDNKVKAMRREILLKG